MMRLSLVKIIAGTFPETSDVSLPPYIFVLMALAVLGLIFLLITKGKK